MSQGPSRVAILGATKNPDRISYLLLQRLKNRGDTLFPIHPILKSIDGIPVYSNLQDVPPCEVLSVYVNPSRSNAMKDAFLASPIQRVIFNPGAENRDLQKALVQQGKTVEEACSLVLVSQGLL